MPILSWSVLSLLACAWSPPLDPDAPQVLNSLAGTVVYSGEPEPQTVIVLLFAADDPPPPAGTGRPVAFSTVPASEFTGDGAGLQSAPWTLSRVPDGDWLVTALMDMDGDFHPLLSSNAGATCGDYGGAHLQSLSSSDLGVVSVEGGTLLDEVAVLVVNPYPTERPAWQFDANAVDQLAAAVALADPSNDDELFTLSSTGVASEVLQLSGPFDGTDLCDTAFWVHFVDSDADGLPDPHPEDAYAALGIPHAWPRIYLQYLDLNEEQLAAGESYVAEAIVNPLLIDLYGGPVPVGVPTPLTQLSVAFVPAAQHLLADGSAELLQAPDLPAGAWSVTVVAQTGQTWTLPNELAAFQSTDDSFTPASQAQVLVVQ